MEFYGTCDPSPKYMHDYEKFKPEFLCLLIGDIVGEYEFDDGKPDTNEVLFLVAFGHTQLKVTAEFMVKGEKKLTEVLALCLTPLFK